MWVGSPPQSWRKVTLCPGLVCSVVGGLGLGSHLRRVCAEFKEVRKKGFAMSDFI